MRERRIYDDPSPAATSLLPEGFYHFLSHFTCGNSQLLDVLRPPIQLKRYHHSSDRWFIAQPLVFRWAFDQAGSISRTFPVRVPSIPNDKMSAVARPSRSQQNLACRFAPLELPVGLGRLPQRKCPVNPDFQLAAPDPVEHVARAPHQFLARERVMEEARTRQE